MKGKHPRMNGEKEHDTKSGPNSRVETEKEAHEGDDGFNKGGKVKGKKHGKVHGKKAHSRHDKRDRKGRFAAGGAVESEAGKTKMRPGFGESKIDREDD